MRYAKLEDTHRTLLIRLGEGVSRDPATQGAYCSDVLGFMQELGHAVRDAKFVYEYRWGCRALSQWDSMLSSLPGGPPPAIETEAANSLRGDTAYYRREAAALVHIVASELEYPQGEGNPCLAQYYRRDPTAFSAPALRHDVEALSVAAKSGQIQVEPYPLFVAYQEAMHRIGIACMVMMGYVLEITHAIKPTDCGLIFESNGARVPKATVRLLKRQIPQTWDVLDLQQRRGSIDPLGSAGGQESCAHWGER